MTAALAFAFGALVANGLFDVVYKRAAQAGVAPHTLLMTQAWCFTAFIVGYGLISETLVWNRAAAWGAAAGVFLFAGLYNFARSLQHGAVSVNAPVFRMNFLVTALLAVALLGETLTLAAQAAVFVTLATIRARWVEGRITPGRTALAYGAGAALMLALGLLLLLAALERGPASRLVPIAQMGFAVSAVVGIAFLGERPSARRLAGLALALTALASLAWGEL